MMEKINYLNGVYEGQLLNGVPNGKGILKWESGDEYHGQWENGKMTGFGIRIIGDGHGGHFSKMQGYFENGDLQYPDIVNYDML